MNLYRLSIFVLFVCFSSLDASSQQTPLKPVVKVSGEVTRPLTLSMDDLSKMKQLTLNLKGRDSNIHNYTGVRITDILELAGVTMGKELRGENLAKYLLVKCADGYQVLFSLAELDSSFLDRKIILAYQSEGRPLAANMGPFRLVVADEKKPARSSFQVKEFLIKFAKE